MRQIRFLGILLACFVLFASTGFGQIPVKTLKISNKSEFTAYCAYSYLVDAETAAYGEEIGFHVKGWVRVPSGRAADIQYRSKFKPNVYFILENGTEIRTLENGSEIREIENEKQVSVHPLPAPLLDAITAKRKPRVEKFEILQDFEGEIVSVSGANKLNMKTEEFYAGKNVTIRGPNKIFEKFDGEYSRLGFIRSGTDYALLFATNDYFPFEDDPFDDDQERDQYWPDLNTPIHDAEILGQELANYGFEVDIQKNLKTQEAILDVIAAYAKKVYKTGDQLFVYFAGHGEFNETLKDGYIAAGMSKLPKYEPGMGSYLAYAELEERLDKIKCDRVMLTLDVCYGGTLVESDPSTDLVPASTTRGSDVAPTSRGVVLQLNLPPLNLQKTLAVKTRWYLSSGGKEKVQDGVGENSPFALALASLLRNGAGADGVLTIPEIEKQLPSKLQVELDKLEAAWKKEYPLWEGEIQQTPRSGAFESGEAGDKAFVFIKR